MRFQMSFVGSAALAVGCVGLWAAGASASTVAYTISNTSGAALANPPLTLGFGFAVSESIVVSSLGVFDSTVVGDPTTVGLIDSHPVGIYTYDPSTQATTLVASATVGAGTTGTLVNQFRYASITPVTLTPGIYVIGALYSAHTDGSLGDELIFAGNATDFHTASDVTFLASTAGGGSGLSAPIFIDPATAAYPGYFGPNFQFTPAVVAVPLPASVYGGGVLLLACGVSGARRARR